MAHAGGRVHHRRPHVPRRLVPPPAHSSRRAAVGLLAVGRPGALSQRPVLLLRDRARRSCRRRIRVPFPRPIREGFVFEDVGFIYPGAERWAVRHLSFTLKAGEVVALVGENGAGKTTLVKLLTRLYDPGRGPHPARWPRPARIRPRRAARQHGRHLPGFRALQFHRRRQYRRRPHRGARRPARASSGRRSAAWPTR